MAKEKIVSEKFSFKGFDYKQLIYSLEKPAVAIIAAIVAFIQSGAPEYSAMAGFAATILYNVIKYFVSKYTA